MERLRPFYVRGRKVLLMFKIRFQRGASPWKVAAALACFLSAILAGIVGIVFTTGWILNAQLHPWMYQMGLALLILAIPILLLGGHCLDLMEPNKRNRDTGLSRTK